MRTGSSDYNFACDTQEKRRKADAEKQKSLERLGEDEQEECAKQAEEIKLRNLDSKYKASHHVQMVLTHSGDSNLPAHMEWQQKLFTGLERMHFMLDWVADCRQQRRNTTHLITGVPHENRATAVWKFLYTLSILAAKHERDAWQTNYLAVSIAIYEWPVLVPVTTRCLGRQGWPIKSQRSAESLLLLLSFNWTWFA